MKRTSIIQRHCLFILALVLVAPIWSKTGDTNPAGEGIPQPTETITEMTIATLDDWREFAAQVSNGNTSINVTMTADIDFGKSVQCVGSTFKRYSGTFDGGNHTITINWSTGVRALFYNVDNATIKNLRIKGSISLPVNKASGLVSEASGTTTFTNCISEVNITYMGKDDASAGGFIGQIIDGGDITFNDCVVAGTFTGTNSSSGWGGFVAYQSGTCVMNNCLYVGTSSATTRSYTFAPAVATTNCYYLNACGAEQGTQVTAEQLASGEVAYLLQNGRTENIWGQTLGTDTIPQLTADAARHIYKVAFMQDEQTLAARYANYGNSIFGSMPTVQDIMGDSYNAHHYYTLAFPDGFSASTAVTADTNVPVAFTDNEYFEIATKDDWKAFCALQKDSQNGINGKLMTDIDLGTLNNSEIFELRLGIETSKAYSGTLDGNGHLIALDWSGNYVGALIGTVRDATVRSLRVRSKLSASVGMSGLIGRVSGACNISNCSVDVDFTTQQETSAASGGLIGAVNSDGNATISDCVVSGKFTGTTANQRRGWCGFVSGVYGTCTLTNCLYIGTNEATDWSYTFAKDATLNNCYYLNACGAEQGTQITEEQLKSGYVLGKLGAAWAQTLGEMPGLYSEADKGKDNYVYYDAANSKWVCGCYKFSENVTLPIGIDFTAAKIVAEEAFLFSPVHGYTWCLPFEQPIESFSAYTLSGCDGSTLRFKEVTGKLEAYRPYYIVLSGLLARGGSDIEVKAFDTDALTSTVGNYSFVGTVEGIGNAEAAAAGAYILQSDNLWHKVTTDNADATIPPYRAYITLPASPAKALSISLGDDGAVTGLRAIETTDHDGTVRYYDLQGRYIGTTLAGQPEGVYMGNGKKLMKK